MFSGVSMILLQEISSTITPWSWIYSNDLNSFGNNYEVGNLFWNVDSLHVYSRNFYLVDHYSKTGDIHIGKAEYQEKYPHSEYR